MPPRGCDHHASLRCASSASLPCGGCLARLVVSTVHDGARALDLGERGAHAKGGPPPRVAPLLFLSYVHDLSCAVRLLSHIRPAGLNGDLCWRMTLTLRWQIRDFASRLSAPTPEQLNLVCELWPVVHSELTYPSLSLFVDDAAVALVNLSFVSMFFVHERFGQCPQLQLWTQTVIFESFGSNPASLALATQTVMFARSDAHLNLIPLLVHILTVQPCEEAWELALHLLTPNDDFLAQHLEQSLPQACLVEGISLKNLLCLQCAVKVWSAPGACATASVNLAHALCDILLSSNVAARIAACECIEAYCRTASAGMLEELVNAGATNFVAGLVGESPEVAMHALFAMTSSAPVVSLMGHLHACLEPCIKALQGYPAFSDDFYLRALSVIEVAAEVGDVTDSQALRVVHALGDVALKVHSLPKFQVHLARSVSAVGIRSFEPIVHQATGQFLRYLRSFCVDADAVLVLMESFAKVCEYAPDVCLECIGDQGFLSLGLVCGPAATLTLVRRVLEIARADPQLNEKAVLLTSELLRAKLAETCLLLDSDASSLALQALCSVRFPFCWDWPVSDFAGPLQELTTRAWMAGRLPALAVLSLCVFEVHESRVEMDVLARAFAAALHRGERSADFASVCVLAGLEYPHLWDPFAEDLLPWIDVENLALATRACLFETHTRLIHYLARNRFTLTDKFLPTLFESWGQHQALCVIVNVAPQFMRLSDWSKPTCLIVNALPWPSVETAATLLESVLQQPMNLVERVELAQKLAIFISAKSSSSPKDYQLKELTLLNRLHEHSSAMLGLKSALDAIADWGADSEMRQAFFSGCCQSAALKCGHVAFLLAALRCGAACIQGKVLELFVEVACQSSSSDKRAACASLFVYWSGASGFSNGPGINPTRGIVGEDFLKWLPTMQASRVRLALLGDVFETTESDEEQRLLASRALAEVTLRLPASSMDSWSRIALCRVRHRCFTDVPCMHGLLVSVLCLREREAGELRICAQRTAAHLAELSTSRWIATHGGLCLLLAATSHQRHWVVPRDEAEALLALIRRARVCCSLAATVESDALQTNRPNQEYSRIVAEGIAQENASSTSITSPMEWARACSSLMLSGAHDAALMKAPLAALEARLSNAKDVS